MTIAAALTHQTYRSATGFSPATAKTVAMPVQVNEAVDKDALISWFRGEFAAANAIIDTMCSHLMITEDTVSGSSEYEAVFAAIHRRRLNWIPVLQMQKYHSIAKVAIELQKVAAKKEEEKDLIKTEAEKDLKKKKKTEETETEKVTENGDVDDVEDDSPTSDITDSGK